MEGAEEGAISSVVATRREVGSGRGKERIDRGDNSSHRAGGSLGFGTGFGLLCRHGNIGYISL